MKQLSMTDAFMLAAETDNQKVQMASVSILAPPAKGQRQLTRQALHDLVAARIHLAPALSRKLVHVPLSLDFPYWADDPDIDLDYHVRECALPPRSNDQALSKMVSELVSEPLDHARPLWQLILLTGMTGHRAAVVFKLHHAAVDGISGLDLHTMLFDQSPEGRNVPRPSKQRADSMPSKWEMLARGVASLPKQPLRSALGGIRSLPYLDQVMPFRVIPGSGAIAGVTRRVARLARVGGEGMLIQGGGLTAPKTLLDEPVTSARRNWGFTQVPLDEAKRVKNQFGITLNDVIVATMAGAIRERLIELDGLPAEPLVALVPVSVRSDDAESGGNLVQVMLIELPTNESDPAERVRLTHEALRDAKERHNAVPATALSGADEFLMPALFIRASRAATMMSGMAGVTSNVVISNVPGPPTPVYIAGARVEAFYPVGGVIEGFGFSTIVFSYCADLQVGFTSTGGTADPWRLAKAYNDSHRELVGMTPPPTAPKQVPAETK